MEKHSKLSKNFIAVSLLFLLLIVNFAIAEEFVVGKFEEIEYKGITFELVTVGSGGSASLKIDGISYLIGAGKQKSISGLNITLLETTSDTAKVLIVQDAECIIDADCATNDLCMVGKCTIYQDCIFEAKNGCLNEGECVPVGTITNLQGELSFCSPEYEWENRKPFNTPCNENYECLSNLCQLNKCTRLQQEESSENMAPAWLLIIFGVLILIIGGFMLYHPEKSKNIFRELSYKKIFNFRIFGAFLAVIGILLIVWALA